MTEPAWVRPANPFDRVWTPWEIRAFQDVAGRDVIPKLDDLRRGQRPEVPTEIAMALQAMGHDVRAVARQYWEYVHLRAYPPDPPKVPAPPAPLPRTLPLALARGATNPLGRVRLQPSDIQALTRWGSSWIDWRNVQQHTIPRFPANLAHALDHLGWDGDRLKKIYDTWYREHFEPRPPIAATRTRAKEESSDAKN